MSRLWRFHVNVVIASNTGEVAESDAIVRTSEVRRPGE
jgi:hypothetical protein